MTAPCLARRFSAGTRRILVALVAVHCASVRASDTPPPFAPAHPVSVSRTVLVPGDPLRDWFVLWRVEGGIGGDAALVKDRTTIPLGLVKLWNPIAYEETFDRAVRVPASATP